MTRPLLSVKGVACETISMISQSCILNKWSVIASHHKEVLTQLITRYTLAARSQSTVRQECSPAVVYIVQQTFLSLMLATPIPPKGLVTLLRDKTNHLASAQIVASV